MFELFFFFIFLEGGVVSYGLFELFERYCREHYFPMYRVSLKLTRENIERLYELYVYGVTNNKSLYASLIDLYGYRYRRLENFAKECFVWRTWWVRFKHIVTLSFSTGERESNFVAVVFNLIGYAPLAGSVDYRLVREIFEECSDFVGLGGIIHAIPYEPVVGVEVVVGDFNFESEEDFEQEWRVEYLFSKGVKTYHFELKCYITNYYLFGYPYVEGEYRFSW